MLAMIIPPLGRICNYAKDNRRERCYQTIRTRSRVISISGGAAITLVGIRTERGDPLVVGWMGRYSLTTEAKKSPENRGAGVINGFGEPQPADRAEEKLDKPQGAYRI
jgi:hypothetical protein